MGMELAEIFQRLGTAIGLGLVVGLQRERSGPTLAGIRTFPLITLLGTLCGLLGPWPTTAGLVALALVIAAGSRAQAGEKDPGLTTEVTMLVMFGIGAALASQPVAPAIAAAGAVSLLLHLKPQMHGFAAKLGDQDFKAVMQFVVVSLIILPALPDRNFGPYHVLNPQRLWLTVVLIVGISLAGFLIYRFFGQRAGVWAAGFLGGLISSTATTVSYSRRTKSEPSATKIAAVIIMIASTIVFARVLAIIGATAPNFLPKAVLPLGTIFIVAGILSFAISRHMNTKDANMPAQGNPTELRTALVFVAIYAVVLIAVGFAKEHWGSGGLYLVAILSGLTDMDAITLSISQMVQGGRIEAPEGWRLILTAGMSNLVFKAGIVAIAGSRDLLKRIGFAFSLAMTAGLATIFLWPDQ